MIISLPSKLVKLQGNHNKYLLLAAFGSLILTTAVIYIPFLAKAFDFAPISLEEYATALGLAFAIIPLVEIIKAFQRALAKGKK